MLRQKASVFWSRVCVCTRMRACVYPHIRTYVFSYTHIVTNDRKNPKTQRRAALVCTLQHIAAHCNRMQRTRLDRGALSCAQEKSNGCAVVINMFHVWLDSFKCGVHDDFHGCTGGFISFVHYLRLKRLIRTTWKRERQRVTGAVVPLLDLLSGMPRCHTFVETSHHFERKRQNANTRKPGKHGSGRHPDLILTESPLIST